jgi:hypothetical protein
MSIKHHEQLYTRRQDPIFTSEATRNVRDKITSGATREGMEDNEKEWKTRSWNGRQ